jgi:FixJ family two-component response regulator
VPESRIISIVDDDARVRNAIRDLVEALGYAVASFESAEEFLRSGRVAETACLILDVEMPGMNGLELHNRLLAEGHGTPVIFITGIPEKLVRARALDAGALGFLTKPISAESLLECLKVALSEPK